MSNGSEFKMMTAKQAADLMQASWRARENGGGDGIARLKLFGLGKLGSWTWLLSEYDPETRVFFGLVKSEMCPDGELGYVARDDIEPKMNRRAIMTGAWIERDLHFEPCQMAEAK